MKVFHSDEHRCHVPRGELSGGEFVTPFERPARVEFVLDRLKEVGLADICAPAPLDMRPVRKVHAADYLAFLESAWEQWHAAGFRGEVVASVWPARRMRQRPPDHIEGKVGYYALAAETSITATTWRAAQAAAAVALAAQNLVASGAPAAFALCRPPGHHAARDLYGGYCFLNNAAIAAQAFLDAGAHRIAILDVDFHHGNGTQDIFYDRADVLFCSLHGDPGEAFPYFSGYADERGSGAGDGFNLNVPLPRGTGFAEWGRALDDVLARIGAYGPDALVVSLGVDTYKDDPIGFFEFESDDFHTCGGRIGKLKRPTAFVLEGGYAVCEIGINVVNVLQGFLGG